jgi:hypothetical protein
MAAPVPQPPCGGDFHALRSALYWPIEESTMPEPASLIMLQFLAWVADRPRTYAATMEAWHSTCPRLSVWEDAIIDGLVRIDNEAGRPVRLTPRGSAILEESRAHAI